LNKFAISSMRTLQPVFCEDLCKKVESAEQLIGQSNVYMIAKPTTDLSVRAHLKLDIDNGNLSNSYLTDYDHEASLEKRVTRSACQVVRLDSIGILPDHAHLITIDGSCIADVFGSKNSFTAAMNSHGAYFGFDSRLKLFDLQASAYFFSGKQQHFEQRIVSHDFSPILLTSDKNDKCLSHWLWGKLPQLRMASHLLSQLPNPILVSTYELQRWQLEQLHLLVPTMAKIPVVTIDSPVFMDHLYVVFGSDQWLLDREYIDFLGSIGANRSGAHFTNRLHLYLSRSDALTRRIVNENELEETLRLQGYVKVRMTDYSFLEQVAMLSRSASVLFIAGSHGALLPFLPRDCKVRMITNDGCPEELEGWLRAAPNLGQRPPEIILARSVSRGSVSFNDDLYIDPHVLQNHLQNYP